MPNRRRLLDLALGIVAVLFLFTTGMTVWSIYEQRHQSADNEAQINQHPARGQAQTSPPALSSAAVEGKNPTNSDQSACGDSNDCARKDLVAQQRMAESTDSIVVLSRWQVGAAIGGTILGLVTIGFAWWAASAASRAAKAAEKTVTAAQKANTIFTAEKRPWLDIVRDIECEFEERERSATVKWWFGYKNYGLSPAVDINVRHEITRLPNIGAILPVAEEFYKRAWELRIEHSGVVVFPGQESPKIFIETGTKTPGELSGKTVLMVVVTYRFALGGGYGMEAQTYEFEQIKDAIGPRTHKMLRHTWLRRTR